MEKKKRRKWGTGRKIAAACLTMAFAMGSLMMQTEGTQAATQKITSIKLDVTTKILKVGETVTLKVKTVTPKEASMAVTWQTSDKKTVTVSTKGKITAKKAGTATITAVSKNNKKIKAVCKVTVYKKEKVTHSGSYKKTKWTIDKNGLLDVTGTGNMHAKQRKIENYIWDEDCCEEYFEIIIKENPVWCDYADEIKSARIKVTGATDLSELFSGCKNLKTVDLSGLDTGSVTKMENMFFGCNSLTGLDLSQFHTSKVTDMNNMFYGCSSLTNLDLSNFDTSKVTDMKEMFLECDRLVNLDLSNFDTSNVKSMLNIVSLCNELNTIHTPKKTGNAVGKLPEGTWKDSTGKVCTEILGNVSGSGILVKEQDKASSNYKKATSIKLNATKKTIKMGDIFTLKVNKTVPSNASKSVIWQTSNEDIASVTAKGLVFAKKAGNVRITAINKNNKKVKAVCNLTVKKNENIEDCGSYKNTRWTLDKNGLLTVKGTGNMYPKGENPPWGGIYGIWRAKIEVTGATSLREMFLYCSYLEEVDLSKLDTSNVTDMSAMFQECTSIEKMDVGNFDTSNVEDMNSMFRACDNLKSLDLSKWDTSSVTDMSNMFSCYEDEEALEEEGRWYDERQGISLTNLDLSNFDTTNVTNMSGMFQGCKKLTNLNVSNFDTTNVTDMSGMFGYCKSLESLDISGWNVANVINMERMFHQCKSLKSLDIKNFHTLKVTSMENMFAECQSLESLDLSSFDTSKVTSMENMFYNCLELETLDISNFDISKVEKTGYMFQWCKALNRIHTPKKSGSNVPYLCVSLYESTTEEIFVALPKNATESMVLIGMKA